MKQTLIATLLAAIAFTGLGGEPEFKNPKLEHLKAQYTAALELLLDEQTETPIYADAVVAELRRHAGRHGADLAHHLLTNTWKRYGHPDQHEFIFNADGTVQTTAGKPVPSKWEIVDGQLHMVSAKSKTLFRLSMDGNALTGRSGNTVITFERIPASAPEPRPGSNIFGITGATDK